MSSIRCVRPTKAHVESFRATLATHSKCDLDETVKALLYYVKDRNAVQFGSMARTVLCGPQVCGFFAANLVDNNIWGCLEGANSRDKFLRCISQPPLSADDLARISGSHGVSLVQTQFLWDKDSVAHHLFVPLALNHLVKWFEGNRIEHVILSFESEFQWLAEELLPKIDTTLSKKLTMDDGLTVVRIDRPWSGPDPIWNIFGKRLLPPAFRTEPVINLGQNNRVRLLARILHEFDFDYSAASSVLRSCIKGDLEQSLKRWQLNVAASLLTEEERESLSRAKKVRSTLQARFAEHPELMVPAERGRRRY